MQRHNERVLLQNRMQISTHQTRAGGIGFPPAYKETKFFRGTIATPKKQSNLQKTYEYGTD